MEKLKAILLMCVLMLPVAAEPLDFKEIIKSKKIKYIKVPYRVSMDKERLSQIYKIFIKDDSIVSISHPMVVKTINTNPDTNFSNLKKSQRFKLYVSVDLLDWDKLSKYQLSVKESERIAQKSLDRVKERLEESPFRYSVFYMASYGSFAQENPAHADVTFLQNSPISFGLSTSFYPKEKPYNLSGSIYYSYLTTALIDQTDEEVKVDPEIGGNIYFSYKLDSPRMSLYGGVDFEKFNTFNLENLQVNGLVTFDTNQVTYLTIGMSKSVDLFGHQFFTKLSYSHSIVSRRTNSYSASEFNDSFSGSKILFYLFKNLGNNFFAHSLFKYHWMSGPSDITTFRLGVGFGYIL
ncbi:hypothetical protein ACRXCV_15335 [Halobacteriovorax sp. GFR7]|uniref:hypothetical protein n=1 Tax=unclassified Halobacteriovorax TaxID=2639665 RepID=UPI003D992A44